MNSTAELPFRIVFGVLYLLSFVVRIYFQRKVKGVTPLLARHERRARLFFRLMALAYVVMLGYVFTPWLDFAHFGLPAWLRWVAGVGLLLAYIGLFAWTHIVLGRNWSPLVEIHADHRLITGGPYRLVRHPIYTAFFCSAFGFLFLSANWLISGLYLAAVTVMVFDRMGPEEQMMLEHFGEPYRQYMQKTGQLLPRLFR